MTVETGPIPHARSITVEEFDALPVDTSHRYEIENGLLLVNARPAAPHTLAAKRLMSQLDEQLPDGLESFPELEAELSGRSPRRVPDVVVIPFETVKQVRIRADQIVLAIEIATSGESAVRNYSIKAGEYATNSIAHYRVVDILNDESPGITIYTLDADGRYRISPRATGVVTLDEPFPLTIDLDNLTAPRRKAT